MYAAYRCDNDAGSITGKEFTLDDIHEHVSTVYHKSLSTLEGSKQCALYKDVKLLSKELDVDLDYGHYAIPEFLNSSGEPSVLEFNVRDHKLYEPLIRALNRLLSVDLGKRETITDGQAEDILAYWYFATMALARESDAQDHQWALEDFITGNAISRCMETFSALVFMYSRWYTNSQTFRKARSQRTVIMTLEEAQLSLPGMGQPSQE